MVKKIQYSNEELKPIVLELEMELLNIRNAMGRLETRVGILQTGGKNGPYWNGSNAYKFFKFCTAQIEHNYCLLANLEQCLEYLKAKSGS